MGRAEKGSLTIFSVLGIMLIAALIFTLLEAGRMHQSRIVAEMNTQSVLESVFANYEIPMWETYQLLVLDNGYSEGQDAFTAWEWYVQALSEENVSSESSVLGSSHLSMGVEQVTFEEYRLLTDDEGKAFISATAAYEKEHLAQSAMNTLVSQYRSLQNMSSPESLDTSAITNADKAIVEAQLQENEAATAGLTNGTNEMEAGAGTADTEGEAAQVQMEVNPLQIVQSLWSTGVLNVVLQDTKTVSKGKTSMAKAVSNRTLKSGTAQTGIQTEFLDELLFIRYLTDHFSCYTEGTASGVLQYELEYLLCGKNKDEDNLRLTAERLLAARMAANLIALGVDSEKQGVAYAAAVTLAGATANPLILYAVKLGLLSAWALAESILDVRTLLSGGKIAVIKSSTQWTSDLLHLSSTFRSFGKSIDCSNGLTYQQYLGYFLMANEKKSAYRAMDIQEAVIREMEGYEAFSMDYMVIDAKLSIDYRYRTIFMGMEAITARLQRAFTISTTSELSYRKAGA